MQDSGMSFYHLGIAPNMLRTLEKMRFVTPTPIQHKAIPVALEGKDIVGVAQTGTGKTLAFGIPLVQRLAQAEGDALVLVPTRELALQVNEALQGIMRPFGLRGVVLIGGAPIYSQIQALRSRPRVVVATPGRLIDHLEQGTVSLKGVRILVLDEADRMFDMGFAPQVDRILRAVPTVRQTMLFSATMPGPIVSLATRNMKLPIHVEIAPSGTAAQDVTQELFIVKPDTKNGLLNALLGKYRGSVLLFTRTKAKARKVTRYLRDLGHNAAEIHSDRSMGQRRQAMEGFKAGRFRILVATDIAARGIDVRGIELVLNYDLPDDLENYVHRIGRTGRAGRAGHAVSFATPEQGADVGGIERIMRKALPRGEHPEFPQAEFYGSTQAARSGPRRPVGRSFKPRGARWRNRRRR